MNWQAVWRQRSWTARGLLPVAWVYGLLLRLQRTAYRWGIKQPGRLPVPVLVVGNVVIGGAGKTPTTVALVRHLQARGMHPGVVSRGYGRQTQGCLEVTPASHPTDTGDEPMLIQRATGAPVVVGASRHQAGLWLLQQHPEIDVVVCDDGMQHWALARDLTVVVFDERGCGNGWLLPAGLLREPWPAPAHTGSHMLVLKHSAPALTPAASPYPTFAATRQLGALAVNALGSRRNWTDMGAAGHEVSALAGIAQPRAFFDMLAAQGVQLHSTQALADHASPESLRAALKTHPGTWLCTEKDAIKLFPVLLAEASPDLHRVWAVPLEQTPEPAFFAAIDQVLNTALQRLSFPHGPQTA